MTCPCDATLSESLDRNHERVVIVSDSSLGLRAVIAVHSTVLGPSLGGLRIRRYEQGLPQALDDALRLSSAMTLKAAAAGLDLGGGKAVMLDDGREELREDRLAALALEIDKFQGRYITAADIGTGTGDMDLVARHTPYVVGLSTARNGGVAGDPSPATARTVLSGIRSALEVLDGSDHLDGRKVGVVGLGKVGGSLATWLHEAGAEVIAYDPSSAVDHTVNVERVTSAAEIFARPLDVLAPCAVGAMIGPALAATLRCRIVCGAANNPLAGAETAQLLADRGVLYVPDFLANCGGLIHADAERRGADAADVEGRMDEAATRIKLVLREARQTGREPGQVAQEHAERRIALARSAPLPQSSRV